jgi:hypothetical protein
MTRHLDLSSDRIELIDWTEAVGRLVVISAREIKEVLSVESGVKTGAGVMLVIKETNGSSAYFPYEPMRIAALAE